MEKKNLVEELSHFENELLGVHNKMQEAINLARDGKWYHADTKLQGTKQKLMNLYEGVESLKREINSEDTSD
jgi:hypothetical protein